MIYGSVCSGIEAATVAWEPLGWKPSFYSDIEAFPRAVLQHHYPDVPLHGDFTTIGAKQYEPIDLLVGGTPCQSFSVAGLRKGMDDERGNLALEYLKLAQRTRPTWLVWENVPGVLSNDGGRAFGSILGGLGKLGYGFAYRILNAQFFGVPQRRRRIFLVAYLGDWRPPAAVLFERESLSGNLAPSRNQRQNPAPPLQGMSASGKQTFGTLMANAGTKQWLGNQEAFCGDFHIIHGTQDPLISDQAFPIGRNNGQENVSFGIPGNWIGREPENGGNQSQPSIEYSPCTTKTDIHAIAWGLIVRKITPIEGERLQGFKDNYTKVPFKGKPAISCPDGHRYSALGNSMAVVVMRWLGERIEMVNEILKQQVKAA